VYGTERKAVIAGTDFMLHQKRNKKKEGEQER